MQAHVLIRAQPHYRQESIIAGLERCGYRVSTNWPTRCEPGDVLAIWNRYGRYDEVARQFERDGGSVLVFENGYLGDDDQGRQRYAIALSGHNGSGRWHIGSAARWQTLGCQLAPWRPDGQHILVAGQRGIGPPGFRSPPGWLEETVARLRKMTDRPVVARQHPRLVEQPPLSEVFRNCWAVVVWSSNTATHALLAGIPVFYCAPAIVTAPACRKGVNDLTPLMGDREEAMVRMAWAQWSVSEIESGLPFRHLLSRDPAPRPHPCHPPS